METLVIVAALGLVGIVICLCGWLSALKELKELKKRIVVVSDNVPGEKTLQSVALKLSNEIYPFVIEKDGKLYLKVVKEKEQK